MFGVYDASSIVSWRIGKDNATNNRFISVSTTGTTAAVFTSRANGNAATFYLTTATFNGTAVAMTSIGHAGNGDTDSLVGPGTTFLTSTVHLCVGAQQGNTALWEGDIAEIVVYNRLLTGDEVSKLTVYFMNKWGL